MIHAIGRHAVHSRQVHFRPVTVLPCNLSPLRMSHASLPISPVLCFFSSIKVRLHALSPVSVSKWVTSTWIMKLWSSENMLSRMSFLRGRSYGVYVSRLRGEPHLTHDLWLLRLFGKLSEVDLQKRGEMNFTRFYTLAAYMVVHGGTRAQPFRHSAIPRILHFLQMTGNEWNPIPTPSLYLSEQIQ